jgi:hypothetical protein
MSVPFKVDQNDLSKIGTGLLIALAGAASTYIAEQLSKQDFGQWTPVVTAASAVVINMLRKWASNTDSEL